MSERWGAEVWLKREDLAHTGAHKINNGIGQALLAKALGAQRVVAETGAGQHGVAAAAACARVGLPCTVYMGEVDVARQAPNVDRMGRLGATVVPVKSGDRTLRAAIDEAIRDWVSDPVGTYYLIGSAIGPHPYPVLVRDLQAVIGREARAQLLEAGGLPDAAFACVGGGSNSIGLFHGFLADRGVALYGVEAGGRGPKLGDHSATLSHGKPGVLHGAHTMLLYDADGQIQETHSVSAGLDYPGVGPEHAFLQSIGRVEYITRERRGSARGARGVLRGRRHPARARELARARGREALGRAQPRQARRRRALGPRRQGHADPRAVPAEELDRGAPTCSRVTASATRSRATSPRGEPAKLVAFVTAGYPEPREFLKVLRAVASVADAVEIGVPFSDPMADGVTIQRSSQHAIEHGVSLRWILDELARRDYELEAPVLLMSYLNPLLAFGGSSNEHAFGDLRRYAFARARGRGRRQRLHRARPAARGKRAAARGSRRARPGARAARDARDAARAAEDALRREPGVRLRGHAHRVSRAARRRCRPSTAKYLAMVKAAAAALPVCAGFGVRRAEQVATIAQHADGVIVGSALVEVLERRRRSRQIPEVAAAIAAREPPMPPSTKPRVRR